MEEVKWWQIESVNIQRLKWRYYLKTGLPYFLVFIRKSGMSFSEKASVVFMY